MLALFVRVDVNPITYFLFVRLIAITTFPALHLSLTFRINMIFITFYNDGYSCAFMLTESYCVPIYVYSSG